jgi:gas vesicle protein
MVIGAAITYLFTNKDGQKVRDVLLKEGTRLLDEVSKKAQSIEERLEEEQVGRELAEKIEGVKKGVEEIEQIVEEVPGHIEQIQKKGRRFFSRRHSQES